ncbi:MAG: hypothetical protein M3220_09070, partial [Chloroflexota bacterium]|nr:hypothetical protein [Chloroflexota bacterium]
MKRMMLVVLVVAGVVLSGFPSMSSVAEAQAVSEAFATETVVLYDGALGGTPDRQGFLYLTQPLRAEATQSFEDGVTTLDTTVVREEMVGYFSRSTLMPTLDRMRGYTVSFTVQVASEDHAGSDKDGDGVGDRAGFSVIVLGEDLKGIELGFWEDEIWAQADGINPPGNEIFTHAEGVAFDTTSDLLPYELTIRGDVYTLAMDSQVLLSGPLRDYTAFTGPIDPYETPNFLFLGDDTSSAQALIRLSYVAVTVTQDLDERLYLPFVLGSMPSGVESKKPYQSPATLPHPLRQTGALLSEG